MVRTQRRKSFKFITPDEARRIQNLIQEGLPMTQVGKILGRSPSAVRNVVFYPELYAMSFNERLRQGKSIPLMTSANRAEREANRQQGKTMHYTISPRVNTAPKIQAPPKPQAPPAPPAPGQIDRIIDSLCLIESYLATIAQAVRVNTDTNGYRREDEPGKHHGVLRWLRRD